MADPTKEQLLRKLNSLSPSEQRALFERGLTSGRGLLGEVAAKYFGIVSSTGQLASRPKDQQVGVLGAFASSLPQGRAPVGETPQTRTGIPGVSTVKPGEAGSLNITGQLGAQPQAQPRTITVGGQPVELPPPQPPPPESPPDVLKQYEQDVDDYNQLIFSLQLEAAQKAAERAGNLEDALALARARETYADIFGAAREERAEGRTIAAESRAQEEARRVRAENLASDLEILSRRYGFEFDAQTRQQVFQSGESAAERQLRLTLQQGEQGFQAGESALDRQLRLSLQQQQLAAQAQESEIDRQFRQMLQDQQGNLQVQLLQLQQAFAGTEAEKNRVIERQRVALEQLSLTEATLARKERLELDRETQRIQKQMAAYDTVMKMVQNPLTFAIYRQAGGLFSNLGSEFAGLDALPVPTETTEQNLARWQARSQFSKEGPGVQGPPPPKTPTRTIPQEQQQTTSPQAQPVFRPQGQEPAAPGQMPAPGLVLDPNNMTNRPSWVDPKTLENPQFGVAGRDPGLGVFAPAGTRVSDVRGQPSAVTIQTNVGTVTLPPGIDLVNFLRKAGKNPDEVEIT